MNTNDPRAQFQTALRNGKLGILRPQTRKADVLNLISDMELGTVDGFYYCDSMEWLFTGDRLEQLRIKFDGPFRTLGYEDGTPGLHCFRAPSGLLLDFGTDGQCERFTLEFKDRFGMLGGIRSLTLHQ